MTSLFAFVDESYPRSGAFCVIGAIIAANENIGSLESVCVTLEKSTGKHKRKWGETEVSRRLEYFKGIYKSNLCHFAYATFPTVTIRDNTVAALTHIVDFFGVTVAIIDGLPKTMYADYALRVRKRTHKPIQIKGANDQNTPVLRLADSLCGLVKDSLWDDDDAAQHLLVTLESKGGVTNLTPPTSGDMANRT